MSASRDERSFSFHPLGKNGRCSNTNLSRGLRDLIESLYFKFACASWLLIENPARKRTTIPSIQRIWIIRKFMKRCNRCKELGWVKHTQDVRVIQILIRIRINIFTRSWQEEPLRSSPVHPLPPLDDTKAPLLMFQLMRDLLTKNAPVYTPGRGQVSSNKSYRRLITRNVRPFHQRSG